MECWYSYFCRYWYLCMFLLLSQGYGEEEYACKCPHPERDVNLWCQHWVVRILGLLSMMTPLDPLLQFWVSCVRSQYWGCRTNGTLKISLSRGIHCLPNFYFICPTSIPILWITCVHTHVSDCVETVYELPLLPNNTASEKFLHKSGAVRIVDRAFIIGMPM
jgi:hypothetical protein